MDENIGAGRFAPSPSGRLHLGNLRTALLAWLYAKYSGRSFIIRVEDLDQQRSVAAADQLEELAAIGLISDAPITYQHDRTARYLEVFETLRARDLVYECYCTRAEIQAASVAPHDHSASGIELAGVHMPPGAYPGTCRELSTPARAEAARRRKPAWRLRVPVGTQYTISDQNYGDYTGIVDDMVLRRADGTFAYNLAVVVDDGDMGIDQVVRGDDLLSSTPRQAYLASLLELAMPEWVHVPLVLGPSGKRLAKRDGAVTLEELEGLGINPAQLVHTLITSAMTHDPGRLSKSNSDGLEATLAKMVEQFAPEQILKTPWQIMDLSALGALRQ